MTLAITFGSLLAVALWELLRPRRRLEFPTLRRRFGNIGIWLFNIILAALLLPPQPALLVWPSGSETAFLFLDFLSYWIHRAQHAAPLLWRLHALHHSDPDVDWSTSVRHHPLEFLIATAAFWLAVLVIGIPAWVVAAHSLVVFGLAAATHGNVRWPAWLDRLLQPVVITLDLHLVHHSIEAAEANANFGAVFSVWDRLFGTLRQPPGEMTFGVAELSRADACRPLQMLLTPWRLPR